MNQPTIRPALNCDLPDLSRLYVEFHQFHVRGVPDRLVSLEEMEPLQLIGLADNLRKAIEHPLTCVYVAELDGRIEGFLEAYERKTDPHPLRVQRRFLYIQSLYVRPNCRGLKLGKSLLDAARKWGRGRGLREIQLDAWEFPGGPQAFYESNGFTTLRRTLVGSTTIIEEGKHGK